MRVAQIGKIRARRAKMRARMAKIGKMRARMAKIRAQIRARNTQSDSRVAKNMKRRGGTRGST